MEMLAGHYQFGLYVILMLIGLYAMMVKKNLLKKVIGMIIFQTAIIFFFIAGSAKEKANIPILMHGHTDSHLPGDAVHAITAAEIVNPLPHVLMLTAIVVGVATLGVALAIVERISQQFGTIEENEVAEQLVQ
jgi:multicomponent Na+:H+ antiporter subunit C